jgi:hypothetical protein
MGAFRRLRLWSPAESTPSPCPPSFSIVFSLRPFSRPRLGEPRRPTPSPLACRLSLVTYYRLFPASRSPRRVPRVGRGGSGRCRDLSPGSTARRLPPRHSAGRFSEGGSWAEIIGGPPIGGRGRPTPERLRRRLCLAISTRSAGAHARLGQGFPGMNRLRKRPAYAGPLKLPGRGTDRTAGILP